MATTQETLTAIFRKAAQEGIENAKTGGRTRRSQSVGKRAEKVAVQGVNKDKGDGSSESSGSPEDSRISEKVYGKDIERGGSGSNDSSESNDEKRSEASSSGESFGSAGEAEVEVLERVEKDGAENMKKKKKNEEESKNDDDEAVVEKAKRKERRRLMEVELLRVREAELEQQLAIIEKEKRIAKLMKKLEAAKKDSKAKSKARLDSDAESEDETETKESPERSRKSKRTKDRSDSESEKEVVEVQKAKKTKVAAKKDAERTKVKANTTGIMAVLEKSATFEEGPTENPKVILEEWRRAREEALGIYDCDSQLVDNLFRSAPVPGIGSATSTMRTRCSRGSSSSLRLRRSSSHRARCCSGRRSSTVENKRRTSRLRRLRGCSRDWRTSWAGVMILCWRSS
jgi:hypothetical protein